MKRFTIIFFVATLFSHLYAQNLGVGNTIKIVGQVFDKETNDVEPFSTIKITKLENTKEHSLNTSISDADGKFNLQIPNKLGNYRLSINSLGKKTLLIDFKIVPNDSCIQLGKLYLEANTETLKGIEVTAQKPLVTMDIDKITYDVASDPDAQAISTFELLRKVPFININGDDKIELNGSTNFLVLQNGRKTSVTRNPRIILKSLPATSIKKIEVVTSPGAKYDADGISGVINIVTQGARFEGHLTDISAGLSTTGGNTNVYNTTKIGKFSSEIVASYSYVTTPKSSNETERENLSSSSQAYLNKLNEYKDRTHMEHLSLHSSYDIDTLRLLTLSVSGMGIQNRDPSETQTTMWNRERSEKAYEFFHLSTPKSKDWSGRVGIDYQKMSPKNKERTTTLSYLFYLHPQTNKLQTLYDQITDNTSNNIIESMQLYDIFSNAHSKSMEHSLQYDFTTPVGKRQTFELGAKYIYRNNESETNLFEAQSQSTDYKYNAQRSTHYRNRNDVLSGYLSYTYRGKLFSFMPGLRYEYTYQKIEYLAEAIGPEGNYNTHYGNIIPSVKVGLRLKGSQMLRIEYALRLSRPSIFYLNPFFDNTNPNYIKQGNSQLGAERNQTIKINYSIYTRKYNFNFALSQDFLNNGIMQVARLIDDDGEYFDDNKHYAGAGAIYSTYQNVGRTRKTTLSFYTRWSIAKNIYWLNNGNIAYLHTEAPSLRLRNHGWTGNINTMLSMGLPKNFRVSATLYFNSPSIQLQGRNSGLWGHNLSLQKSMFNNKLFFILNGSDPFKKWTRRTTTTIGENFVDIRHSKYSRQSINFSIQYRFGNFSRSKTKRAQHTITNDDLKAAANN